MDRLCPCGRQFTQRGALAVHQKTCQRSKKRLSNALAKIRESKEVSELVEPNDHFTQIVHTPEDDQIPQASASAVLPATDSEPDATRPTKRPRQLPLRFRAPVVEMHDKRLQDILPQPPSALPPPRMEVVALALDSHPQEPPVRKVLETQHNIFGIYRRYYSQQFPSHDPEGESDLSNLSNIIYPNMHPPSYGPYPNKSSFRLGEWYWDHGVQKSQASFKELVNIVGDVDFQPSDIRSTNWDKVNKALGDGDSGEHEWEDEDNGWKTSSVSISVPFHRFTPNPGPRDYLFTNFHHRSLISIIREKLSGDNSHFHYEPYELLWRVSNRSDPVRIHGELYNSPAFMDAHLSLQASPGEPGCDLPRFIVALMFWSDGTHLTNFGNAKLWPLYMFFGNESKYRRGKPSLHLCEHVAYFEMLPDSFKDFATTYTGNKKLKQEFMTHCHREFTHAQWSILLDDEFLMAYEHGIVVKCCNDERYRFYPRVITYGMDYMEKILMALIRNRGLCPCPRCTIPLSKVHLVGTQSDRRARTTLARVDDSRRRGLISAARKAIYEQNYDVDSAAVERILKPQSLVPTSNAFSDRLSQFGFDFHTLLLVDLLHEVELGVWKSLFIHLLRIVAAFDESRLHELDRRFRLVPTFGRDTIRRFSSNSSELKRLAARSYEDFLQCAIPVFDGLLPEPHNTRILRLLFTFAHWHGLAKLRMHTDETLTILDNETTLLGNQLREFQLTTGSAYETHELMTEMNARRRHEAKKTGSLAPNGQHGGRRLKSLNLQTYKFHSLGDYVSAIRQYGTTDSYSTAIGELEHRKSKARYKRTSKKNFIPQLARMERRETSIRRIRQKIAQDSPRVVGNERIPQDPKVHHQIGISENFPQRFGQFLQSHHGDPAIADFFMKLKRHILARIKTTQADVDVTPSATTSSATPDSTTDLDRLFFKKECMYRHNIMKINYTTYDIRRAEDVVNPNTDHRDVVLLSANDLDPNTSHHQYVYARVLGIYHVNVIYAGPATSDYSPQRMEFLWVRWFAHTDDEPVQRSWGCQQLDCLQLLPVNHQNAFGFVDPANVLRGSHVMPRFASGRCHPDGRGISRCAHDSDDWRQYYVGRFADRDMMMRYHWGFAVGHIYSYQHPEPQGNNLSCSEAEEMFGSMDEADPYDKGEHENGSTEPTEASDNIGEDLSDEQASDSASSSFDSTDEGLLGLELEEMYGDTQEYDEYD